MNAGDAVHAMLTALFAAGTAHALGYGVLPRGSGWRHRVDHLLHAVMALAMTAMPWEPGRVLPEAAQTAFFVAAASWFPLTGLHGSPGRRWEAVVRRLPYAAGMAAMAWMSYRATGPAHRTPSGDVVTATLALYLLVSALRSLTRDMPALRGPATTARDTTDIQGTYGRFWDGAMALGTAVALLMHP